MLVEEIKKKKLLVILKTEINHGRKKKKED